MRGLEMVAGLMVSVAAFAVLVMGFVWDADASLGWESAEIRAEPEVVAPRGVDEVTLGELPPEPTPSPVDRPLAGSSATGADAAAVFGHEPSHDAEPAEDASEPTGVEVPDLTGRTALRALRQAREAGLEVDIRDREGNRVPAGERLFVRVIDQGNPEGSRVPEGTTISLTARYPRGGGGFASGY